MRSRHSIALAFLLCAMVPAHAATLSASAAMIDSFATAPDVRDEHHAVVNPRLAAGDLAPLLSAQARDAETGAGGTASATAHIRVEPQSGRDVDLALGVQASARSQGNRLGAAQATANEHFALTVALEFSPDFELRPWLDNCILFGCDLAADFLHETTGLFRYSSLITAQGNARFTEQLRIQDRLVRDGEAYIVATQRIGGGAVETGVNGDWSLADFSTPAANQVRFNHLAVIGGVLSKFRLVLADGALRLVGRYEIELTQRAEAGFSSADYAFGELEADFVHTSHFALTGLRDTAGLVDLSGATIDLRFDSLGSVPLPPSILGLATALAVLAARRQRRPRILQGENHV